MSDLVLMSLLRVPSIIGRSSCAPKPCSNSYKPHSMSFEAEAVSQHLAGHCAIDLSGVRCPKPYVLTGDCTCKARASWFVCWLFILGLWFPSKKALAYLLGVSENLGYLILGLLIIRILLFRVLY